MPRTALSEIDILGKCDFLLEDLTLWGQEIKQYVPGKRVTWPMGRAGQRLQAQLKWPHFVSQSNLGGRLLWPLFQGYKYTMWDAWASVENRQHVLH